jgi:hypothetical protein
MHLHTKFYLQAFEKPEYSCKIMMVLMAMLTTIIIMIIITHNTDSLVCGAMGCGLDGTGLIPGNIGFFSSPHRSGRFWNPPRLLSNWYW